MEYERIHKVQTGMISPSKLRMKLMGSTNLRKKDGSNSNSSRTSPSKLDDSDFVNNGLLSANEDEEVTSPSLEALSTAKPVSEKETFPGGGGGGGRSHQQCNSSSVHPVRAMEDDNLDYDSNASSSSFEFHRGDQRSSAHGQQVSRAMSRPVPSKWNDAEKWLVNRQNSQPNSHHNKRNALQNQTNRLPVGNMVKVAPESGGNCDGRLLLGRAADTKRVIGLDKFSFVPAAAAASRTQDSEEELGDTGVPAIRSVSMRDMGTEMTPGTSLEPSRTSTPIGASTPIRSPTPSLPSTPRGGGGGGSAAGPAESQLTEEELKQKTRREIMALGVQLGKMSIAAWAGKEEQGKAAEEAAELERVEYEKRAAVWEEAEKSKHAARYKREEIKIQAWESQQRVKLEAELKRIEAQVEQMRAQAQAKMVKKIAMTRQRSEEKRMVAEARKARYAERTAAQADFIRQTGRTPSSHYMCCGWL